MTDRRLAAAAFLIALSAPCGGVIAASPAAYGGAPDIETLFALVRPRVTGAEAMRVVSLMEQHWRWPGNRGFDASIRHVAQQLVDAGFVQESEAGSGDRLTFRIERRPMRGDAWEPVDATVTIVGDDEPLLRFETNRNMIAINTRSTPPGGARAAIVDVGAGTEADFAGREVEGRIVMGEGSLSRLHRRAVVERGAIGVLYYGIPAYNRPEVHRDSIVFRSIPSRQAGAGWAILLSTAARDTLRGRLARGPVSLEVAIHTETYPAEELTLVADVRGARRPDERFVLSAHVQEPGANDNATGVAVQLDVARTVAELLRDGDVDPARTITFVWGDEITAIARYLREDEDRAAGVRWGMSLDMVGEDTTKTGGTFLIEKMPDPSAVWPRGDDRHTEWGARPVSRDRLKPHYFNDFALARCREQAAATGWVVRTNPYEGGSDHVPFLRAGKPGLLLWHFTDAFYHTDGDRIDKVSAATMANVGVATTVIALALASADETLARRVIEETTRAAIERLETETRLSRAEIAAGADAESQWAIVDAWREWYEDTLATTMDLVPAAPSAALTEAIDAARARVRESARRPAP